MCFVAVVSESNNTLVKPRGITKSLLIGNMIAAIRLSNIDAVLGNGIYETPEIMCADQIQRRQKAIENYAS